MASASRRRGIIAEINVTPSAFTRSSTHTTRPCETSLSPAMITCAFGSAATATRTASRSAVGVVAAPFR